MKVREAIKNTDNFIITKDGNILAIKNEGGDLSLGLNPTLTKEELLNLEVKKIDIIKGVIGDVTGIRL